MSGLRANAQRLAGSAFGGQVAGIASALCAQFIREGRHIETCGALSAGDGRTIADYS